MGPALAADSYLNMDAILRAIDKTGAQAVSVCVAVVFSFATGIGSSWIWLFIRKPGIC